MSAPSLRSLSSTLRPLSLRVPDRETSCNSPPLHNDRQDGAARRTERETEGERVERRTKGGTNSDSDGDECASATRPHSPLRSEGAGETRNTVPRPYPPCWVTP